jgi:lipopolysaccharide/colanic/teichoic acid biosynthesis glycosyltransferase
MIYQSIIKPIFDFLAATLGFLLLLPVFLVIWFVLLISNHGSAFFFQERPGKNERVFKIVKFKTMNDKKDSSGNLLPAVDRLTSFGIFLRKYSLDEIPQLLNVIKGDMSLVGPRPLHVRYLPRYNDFQKQRHLVKPGISGWAQVNGRNTIEWEEKFKFDVHYVKNISFWFDIKILFKTVRKVVMREGIYDEDNQIVPDFMGAPANSTKIS